MAQVIPRYCPRCGAPIDTQSRFCAACGFPVEAVKAKDEYRQPTTVDQNDQGQFSPADEHEQASQDEPPEQQSYQQPTIQTSQAGQQGYPYNVAQPYQERDAPRYPYHPTQKKRSMGRRRYILFLVVLLILLGTTTYIAAGLLGVHPPGFAVVQPPVATMAIDSTVPYAGVDITILNAQQSLRFVDDPGSSTNGMVRLNLREQNKTGIKVSWSYTDIARLILPDKSIGSPTYVNAEVSVASGASQTNVVDFAVPSRYHTSQLTLRLGAINEASMFIPLTGKANVSNYQPKTIDLNGQMQYFGLDWTLTNATSSLSIDGQQATKGMRYIIVTLTVANTLSQIAITGSPYDYIRLKFGTTMLSPVNTTLPVSFDAGVSGQDGTVSFLVPQNTKSFILILIPQPQSGSDQASTDFQLGA